MLESDGARDGPELGLEGRIQIRVNHHDSEGLHAFGHQRCELGGEGADVWPRRDPALSVDPTICLVHAFGQALGLLDVQREEIRPRLGANGEQVEKVFVAGKLVVDGGCTLAWPQEELLADAWESADAVLSSFPEYDLEGRAIDEVYPPCYQAWND